MAAFEASENLGDRTKRWTVRVDRSAWLRRRLRAFWEAFRNCCLNILRYVIIAGLFLYLLTGVVLFNDIMAFHDRVAELVGDDARARRVVLMVHKMHEDPKRYPPGEEELPVGTLAVTLGALQSGQRDLGRFDRFTVARPKDAIDGLAVTPPAYTEADPSGMEIDDDGRERFLALRTQLTETAATFDDYLADNVPEAAILRAIDAFETGQATALREDDTDARIAMIEENLQTFRAEIIKAAGDLPALDKLKTVQAKLDDITRAITAPSSMEQLRADVETLYREMGGRKDVLKALKGSPVKGAEPGGPPRESGPPRENGQVPVFAGLTGSIVTSKGETATIDIVDRIRTTVDAMAMPTLDPIDFSGGMEGLKAEIEALKTALAGFPTIDAARDQLAGFVKDIETMTLAPMSEEAIANYQDGIEAMKAGVETIERNLPIDTVIPTLREALQDMAWQVTNARERQQALPIGEGAPPPDFAQPLADIENALKRRYPDDFSTASSLIGDIGSLRAHLAALETIEPGKYQRPGGEVTEENVEQLFKERMKAMNDDLAEIETKLQKQGRVIALANVLEEDENETAESAMIKAAGILQDFDALKRFGWLMMPLSTVAAPQSVWAQFGLDPPRLATFTTSSITTIYVFLVGAIGSLIYITKYQLKLVLDGHRLRTPPERALPWFLFRPFFGIVIALALYYLVRAGQMAFGGADGDGEVGTTLNIPILSVLALFAGILSWDALRMIETRGRVWFSSQSRQPLWATGLGHGLRMRDRSIGECAEHIGRSSEQVERWLRFADKVPIEMQDRIQTWIELRPDELFGDIKPKDDLAGKPMWAVGLKAALNSREKRLDPEGLVELLREDKRAENIERVRDWIALKLQVSPAMQWRLVDLLDMPHHLLFASELQNHEIWGTRLRPALKRARLDSARLAERLGLSPEQIHAWKELDRPVPPVMQDKLIRTLDRPFGDLFEPIDFEKEKDWLQKAHDLERALLKRDIKRAVFARRLDVEAARVDRWIEGEAIARPTRDAIIELFGGDDPDLFQRRMLADQRGGQPAGDEAT